MGQHTWFVKSKAVYLEQEELYKKLENDTFDNLESYTLGSEVDKLDKSNKAEYRDLFRTGVRNEEKILSSLSETLVYILNPENNVSFKHTVFDTQLQELKYQEEALEKLQEFWEKYPDGLIYFC